MSIFQRLLRNYRGLVQKLVDLEIKSKAPDQIYFMFQVL